MSESVKDKVFSRAITLILILVAFITIAPLLNVLAMSFSSKAAADSDIISLVPVGFTLASWKYIVTDPGLWKSFAITVVTTLIGTALALGITAFTAYPLSKKDFKLSSLIMMLVVGTMIFKAPTVPYFLVLKGMGLYNNPLVLILPHILSAYNLAIMRTFFKAFPGEVEDAAKIDGCGSFGILWNIVLPSSKAALATIGLFYAVTIWNQFQHPMMFISNTDLYPLQMKVRQLINGGGDFATVSVVANVNYTEATLSAATVVFAILPIILVYPWLQKYFVKGAMLGSVKG